MTHGAMVAIHAATAVMHARTKVLDAFRVHGATAPERATSLDRLGVSSDDSGLAHFLQVGVIRAVDTRGRSMASGDTFHVAGYYLDETAYIADRDGMTPSARAERRKAWLVLALTLAVAGIAVTVALLRAS
jgi:hypothetical protein